MINKKIWLAAALNMCILLSGCGDKTSDETMQTTLPSTLSEIDNTETDTSDSAEIENSAIEESEAESNISEGDNDAPEGDELGGNTSENGERLQNTQGSTGSSGNKTGADKTENGTTAQTSGNQNNGQSGSSSNSCGSNTTNSSSDDSLVTVTGEVIASGIGKDTMMVFGKTYRKFSDGTYYCDNGEWARDQGPVADNLNEFYTIMENAIKTGNNTFTMHINVFDESFGRGVEDKFELIKHKGATYYARDRILTTTIEMADFQKMQKKTGKNVYWDLNYYYYVETECKYAPVEVSIYYTTQKMYFFSDREGYDKAVDRAYRDGVTSALFVLKWDQKDEVFSWQEWSDTYAAGPYMVNYNKQYSYFYPDGIIAAEGPETGAFALSKQPRYETFVRWKSLDGVYCCMNELMDDGSIEKRDYSCCYMMEADIVNWHDEIEKYQIPFCNNNAEMMAQVQIYTGDREQEVGYVGYARCSYEEAYNYYLNAMEYVPGNRVMYYMIAEGYWILVKVS